MRILCDSCVNARKRAKEEARERHRDMERERRKENTIDIQVKRLNFCYFYITLTFSSHVTIASTGLHFFHPTVSLSLSLSLPFSLIFSSTLDQLEFCGECSCSPIAARREEMNNTPLDTVRTGP